MLNKMEEISIPNVLRVLAEMEIKKNGIPIIVDIPFNHLEVLKDSIYTINKQYLDQLNDAGLLTSFLYLEFQSKIKENNYDTRLQLLSDLYQRASFLGWFTEEKLMAYAKDLHQNKVVSDSGYSKLVQDLKNGTIQAPFQLNNYCRFTRSLDLSTYSNDPAIYLEQIYKGVSEILPELAFTQFTYKIQADSADSYDDYISYNVIVTLKCNGKTYRNKSFFSHGEIGKDENYSGKLDEQEFYNIFNKILADLQSPYRLHNIQYRDFNSNQGPDYRMIGIIALKEEQIEMFRFTNSYIQVSYEDFKNNLTTKKIENAFEEWKKSGILNHLSDAEIESAKIRSLESDYRDLNDVLFNFPGVIHYLDVELGNLDDPYAEILREFGNISHGIFKPVNISDNFSKPKSNKVAVKFTLNDKTYSLHLKYESDWVDVAFFDQINKAVEENHLPGRFYELYNGDFGCFIFLTATQFDYLKTNKLLLFGNQSNEEE